MGSLSTFTFCIPTRTLHRVKWLALALATFVLLFGLFGLISPVLGAQKHGCAPDVPPAVAQAVPAQALPDEVMINEVLSQPKSSWNCSDPNNVFSVTNDSWIELYNPQSLPLDLYAAHAQISLNGGSTYILLPFGAEIQAQGFLVLFPLEHQAVAAPSTWNIILSINNIVIDQAATPLLQADQSYARVPDGATTWLYAGNPTIDTSNNAIGQPVLPTPTKTPKATLTTTTLTPGSPQPVVPVQPASSGTQPAWGQVQVPSDPTATSDRTGTIDPSMPSLEQPQNSPTTPANTSPGGNTIGLIILFGLLLLGVLFWCWRLFRAP